MCVVNRRQAGTNVQKLINIGLVYQVMDSTGEKLPVGAGLGNDAWVDLDELLAGLPINRVVIFTAEPVIPDAGRVRDRRVDPFHQVFLCFGPRVRRLIATHDNLRWVLIDAMPGHMVRVHISWMRWRRNAGVFAGSSARVHSLSTTWA